MQVPGFILRHTTIRTAKMWQFYLLVAVWTAVFTAMQISVLLFLDYYLDSLFLAGLALAIGHIFSTLLDGFFSSLQKRFSSRSLFIWSILLMMLSILTFMFFSNLFFVYLAAIFFSISFDLMEITAMSYVMAVSLPANYGQNLSYKEVAHGVGLLIGLIISAIVLSASYFIGEVGEKVVKTIGQESLIQNFEASIFIAQVLIFVMLSVLLWAAYIFFDKEIKVLSSEYVKTSFQVLTSETKAGLKTSAINVVEKTLDVLKNESNQVELKSTDEKKKIEWNEIFDEVMSAAKILRKVFTIKPSNTPLTWSLWSVMIFSYWDTFLGTFLPIFFTELLRVQSGWLSSVPGSLLMLVFIVPALGLFPLFAKLGDKMGRHYFIMLGLIITCVSVFFLGFVDYKHFSVFMIAGFGVAIGYVAGMSCARADSASKLNEFVAVTEQKGEIDTNASAGPLMVINNLGNIVGPLLGGFFIESIEFQGFFKVFGILLTVFIIYSFMNYSKITTPAYIFESKQ